jgi:tetratricopeptide (TPR) repeat protein/predicted Ser/Thr protein kinase
MTESHTIDPAIESVPPPQEIAEALPRGALINRYVVLEALGRGGMGAVYAAFDPQLERRVAIKMLHAHLLNDETRARLLKEAQALARLSHPNVVTVHDVGAYGDNVFIAMEYIAGETLKRWLKRERRPWRVVLDRMMQAARGLAAAHAAGVVHRDVKPDNILISDEGRVVVTDFGLARAMPAAVSAMPPISERDVSQRSSMSLQSADGSDAIRSLTSDQAVKTLSPDLSSGHSLSTEGGIIGTVGYMSPEQAWGDPTDARTDQWSFCATLYYGLYGEPPIRARSLTKYIRAAVSRVIDPPASRNVPTWLRRVLKKGLARDPDDRYPTMDALLAALGQDPAAKWRRAGTLALLVAGAASVAAFVANRQRVAREACADDKNMADTWNDQTRENVRKTFIASGAADAATAADRVIARLDDYASKWSASQRETCEATRVRQEMPQEAMYVRYACLERRRTELGALVQLVTHADAQIVERATEAAYGLSPPSSCGDPSALKMISVLPADATERQHVLAARAALANAESLSLAGKLKEAMARIDEALSEARAAHHRGSEAEALRTKGRIEETAGAYETAVATYLSAIAAAEAAADDASLAEAASRLGFITGDKLLAHADAARWIEVAHGALTRLGPNDDVEAKILLAEAPLPTSAGHPEDAVPIFERLVPIAARVYGEEHPTTARAINNFGYTRQMLGEHAAALELHTKAVSMLERTLGAETPSLAIFSSNVGASLIGLGRFDEARTTLEHAFAIATHADPYSFWAGWVSQYQALIALRTGDSARAITLAKRGIDIAEHRGAPAARLLPSLLSIQGRALTKSDPAAAEAGCRRALAVQEKSGAPTPDRVYEWDVLTCLGEALLARGRVEDALPFLEKSAALPRRVYAGDLAMARFALARALAAAKTERARAHGLADQAEKELATAPGREAEHDEVARWLAMNPAN